jgi:DHA1 family inner membrane transport protein
VLAAAAVAMWLPRTGRGAVTRLADEARVLTHPQVLFALALSACVCAATFSVFTYIAPLLTEVAGVSPHALPVYLLLFGVVGVLGMQIGGRFGDRNLMASIIGAFVADFAVFLVLLATCRSATLALPTMFVWGFAFYFMAAPLRLRVIEAAREAPNLASTVIHSAFNFGIAGGPFLGAATLSSGAGYATLSSGGAAPSAPSSRWGRWSSATASSAFLCREVRDRPWASGW